MPRAKKTILDRLLGRDPASADGGKEQTAIGSAEARLATCRENHEGALARAADAHAALKRATAVSRASSAEHDRAILLADREPSSANERAMEQADATARAAEATLAEKRNAAIDADEAVAAVTRAVDDAETELARAQRDAEIAELRERSGPASFASAVDQPARRLLEAYRTMLDAAAEIDAAFAASHAASAKLREMGEHTRDLARAHVIAPFVRASLEEDPARAGVLDRALFEEVLFGSGLHANKPLVGALKSPIFERCFAAPTHVMPPDQIASARENIEAAFGGRCDHDVSERRKSVGQARADARAAASLASMPKARRITDTAYTFDPPKGGA